MHVGSIYTYDVTTSEKIYAGDTDSEVCGFCSGEPEPAAPCPVRLLGTCRCRHRHALTWSSSSTHRQQHGFALLLLPSLRPHISHRSACTSWWRCRSNAMSCLHGSTGRSEAAGVTVTVTVASSIQRRRVGMRHDGGTERGAQPHRN